MEWRPRPPPPTAAPIRFYQPGVARGHEVLDARRGIDGARHGLKTRSSRLLRGAAVLVVHTRRRTSRRSP